MAEEALHHGRVTTPHIPVQHKPALDLLRRTFPGANGIWTFQSDRDGCTTWSFTFCRLRGMLICYPPTTRRKTSYWWWRCMDGNTPLILAGSKAHRTSLAACAADFRKYMDKLHRATRSKGVA